MSQYVRKWEQRSKGGTYYAKRATYALHGSPQWVIPQPYVLLPYHFLTTSLPLPYHFLTTPFPLSSLFNIKAREQHNRAVEAAMLAEDEEHDLGGGFSGGFY